MWPLIDPLMHHSWRLYNAANAANEHQVMGSSSLLHTLHLYLRSISPKYRSHEKHAGMTSWLFPAAFCILQNPIVNSLPKCIARSCTIGSVGQFPEEVSMRSNNFLVCHCHAFELSSISWASARLKISQYFHNPMMLFLQPTAASG